MLNFWKRIKMIFSRDAQLLYTIKEFSHANKNLLIIVADPKSDRIYASFRDNFVNGRIKSPTGKKTHVVKEVLSYSRFPHAIDQFLGAMVETLGVPLWKGKANQFFQFIDGALYNIGKSLRKKKQGNMPGAVRSPFMENKNGRSQLSESDKLN